MDRTDWRPKFVLMHKVMIGFFLVHALFMLGVSPSPWGFVVWDLLFISFSLLHIKDLRESGRLNVAQHNLLQDIERLHAEISGMHDRYSRTIDWAVDLGFDPGRDPEEGVGNG